MAGKQEPEGRSERLGEGLLKFEKLPASEVLYLLQTKQVPQVLSAQIKQLQAQSPVRFRQPGKHRGQNVLQGEMRESGKSWAALENRAPS